VWSIPVSESAMVHTVRREVSSPMTTDSTRRHLVRCEVEQPPSTMQADQKCYLLISFHLGAPDWFSLTLTGCWLAELGTCERASAMMLLSAK